MRIVHRIWIYWIILLFIFHTLTTSYQAQNVDVLRPGMPCACSVFPGIDWNNKLVLRNRMLRSRQNCIYCSSSVIFEKKADSRNSEYSVWILLKMNEWQTQCLQNENAVNLILFALVRWAIPYPSLSLSMHFQFPNETNKFGIETQRETHAFDMHTVSATNAITTAREQYTKSFSFFCRSIANEQFMRSYLCVDGIIV